MESLQDLEEHLVEVKEYIDEKIHNFTILKEALSWKYIQSNCTEELKTELDTLDLVISELRDVRNKL